ncbi:protein translocase subunit SecD, partial [Pseudonocardia sp. DSM 45834]|nr:protein translocase subunit SecD [Pseudonocardia sp. DSM 45834]
MASTPGRIRPWRHLAAFAGIIVALYALVFFTGDKPTPKLGIDLQGGTRVTLTARTESGGEPPREQLLQAQTIIEQRVNGLGVSGAEVLLDGTNITITVPGEEGDQARSLGQTAQLRFREVVGGPVAADPAAPVDPAAPAPGGPSTGDTPSTVSPTGAPSDATSDPTPDPTPVPTPDPTPDP